MKFLRAFFHFTRIFWILSRLVLGLIFCYCAIFLLEGADTMDYLSASFFAMLGLTLLWGFVAGLFRGGAHNLFKVSTGSILILLSVVVFYSTIDVFGMGEAAFLLLLPVWLFLSGIFELSGIRSKSKKFNTTGLPDVS